MSIFDRILKHRGIDGDLIDNFLLPKYEKSHDPFLLPDMDKAVDRLVSAKENNDKITIYGDYDIDGLTATTVLLDGLSSFGFKDINTFIPNRFIEGYGMTNHAVEQIASGGTKLIITVDCGSLSEEPIKLAKSLGVDVIVTDHHNVAPVQPPAVAVINPKRLLQDYPENYKNYQLIEPDKNPEMYPFLDLPGVGVAFKLIQAMQTKMEGLDSGHEKWLLDLVALGTVCDVVTLVDENRMHVYWGLKVLSKTKRPGLKALMAVSGVNMNDLNTRSLGFALGPRMNASGRLETASYAQDLLLSSDGFVALELARKLDDMNIERRRQQDKIFKEALEQAHEYIKMPVLVLSNPDWSHGIIGIVAAKILEYYKKPTYVLQEIGDESKGSARSYGDFSVADAIRFSDEIITKGGGHKFAAGVTLPTKNIEAFRGSVNKYYKSLKLRPQEELLIPKPDTNEESLANINEDLVKELSRLEPFGSGNPEPIIKISSLTVSNIKYMGSESQHLKLRLRDRDNRQIETIAFSAPKSWQFEIGQEVDVLIQVMINEWRGSRQVEGRLLYITETA